MKRMLPTIVTVSMLLVVGLAAAQDAAPAKEAESAKAAEPAKEAAPAKDPTIEVEPPELKRLAGSYTLIGNQADAETVVKAAIETSVEAFGGLKKGVARKRLTAANKIVTRLKISSTGKNVTVGMNDYVVTAPLGGDSVTVKTPSGETSNASFKLETATLVQDLVQSKGRRENKFRFNSEGNLVMHVSETSSQLPTPVSYVLTYKRAGQ